MPQRAGRVGQEADLQPSRLRRRGARLHAGLLQRYRGVHSFLSLFQAELAAHAGVPVATSSLMQVPWVQAALPPGRRVGVVTVCAPSLTAAHLLAAGAPADTPVAGTEGGRELHRVLIRAEATDMDVDLARQDVLDAGGDLLRRHPEVGAVVLECTNMPPYAAALRAVLGVPVYDVYSMVSWFHAGLRPRAWR